MDQQFLNIAYVTLALGLLLGISCSVSRLSSWAGIPISLLFLGLGMLTGQDGLGHIQFANYNAAYWVGVMALILILYHGGLNTDFKTVRRSLAPSVVLATAGVVGVASITAAGAFFVLGWFEILSWKHALLFGAIVASTDAASTFAVLKGLRLKGRVSHTIELESGLNDPVAFILVIALTEWVIGNADLSWWLIGQIFYQLIIGAAVGLYVGFIHRKIMNWIRLPMLGLYPVRTVAMALASYGLASVLDGSGFMAVYLAGITAASGHLPLKSVLLRVHDALAWLGQISMFIVLGLLIKPSSLGDVAIPGTLLGLFIAFIARPASVLLCLLPFNYRWNERLAVSFLGLRGAVPIILAIIPVLSIQAAHEHSEGMKELFGLVFFVVVVSCIVPGAFVRPITRILRIRNHTPRQPVAEIEILSIVKLDRHQQTFLITEDSPAAGVKLRDFPLPEDINVMMIMRGAKIFAARGKTVLEPGDHAFILYPPDKKDVVHNLVYGTDSS